MRITKRRMLGVLGSFLLLSLCLVLAIINLNSYKVASAEETNEDEQFVVTTGPITYATFDFIPLNENECSVSITNKGEATTAIIPSSANIKGNIYDVTEVDTNGFKASSKLIRVKLPKSVRKIGNSAFSNCPELNRIYLSEVIEIGNSAFYKCPKLSELIIPETTKIVGSNILRNNNTQVKLRAESVGDDWSSGWNTNNANQNIVFKYEIPEKYELEEVYNTNARSGEETVVGYNVASGQPRTSDLYVNGAADVGGEQNNIFIPEFYKNQKIVGINQYAFDECQFDNLIVEYSQDSIEIDERAFENSCGTNIIINRPISFTNDEKTENIFSNSEIESVVLPDSISYIPYGMFSGCEKMANIYFIAPSSMSQDEELMIIQNAQEQAQTKNKFGVIELPTKASFNTIAGRAFEDATSIHKLVIPNNVENVGDHIVSGWSNNQFINVGYLKDDYPQYDPQSNTGWSEWWHNNCAANIAYAEVTSTIKLNANDGYIPYDSFDVSYNHSFEKLPEPIDSSATFVGWFAEDGTEYTKDSILTRKDGADITLTARWSVSIKYLESGVVKKEETRFRGESFKLNPGVTKDGYNGHLKDRDSIDRFRFGDDYTACRNITFVITYSEKSIYDCKVILYGKEYYRIYGPTQLRSISSIANLSAVTIELMNDIDVSDSDWTAINTLSAHFDGKGHTITYRNYNVSGTTSFGFFLKISGPGWIENTKFKAKIQTTGAMTEGQSIGVIAAEILNAGGAIDSCEVLKWEANPYYTSNTANNVDILCRNPNTTVGGLVGNNWGSVQFSENYASIGAQGHIGGIAGINQNVISYCKNYGNIYYDHNGVNSAVGGIAGVHSTNNYLQYCNNQALITFACVSNTSSSNKTPCIAQIVGYINYQGSNTMLVENEWSGNVSVIADISSSYKSKVSTGEYAATSKDSSGGKCITEGTLITLADGTQKAVEQLKGDEMLLVWNLQTGTFDAAPILFIDSDPADTYEVTHLYFSDGTEVKIIYEHAFWDFNLNQYVFLRNDATQYIGHWFNKQITDENGQLTWTKVQLTDVVVKDEYTTSWSPVTFSHLCYYVNGMLSMPGATEGLINIFEVDAETMSYNQEALAADVEQYGLFTYEEFAEILPVSQEVFEAFNGQYLKVSIGKGLIDIETLAELIERYSEYFVN